MASLVAQTDGKVSSCNAGDSGSIPGPLGFWWSKKLLFAKSNVVEGFVFF